MRTRAIEQSFPNPADTIESVFGDYTEEEINEAYREYERDQVAFRQFALYVTKQDRS